VTARPAAVFDFDGTLTRSDTLVEFLRRLDPRRTTLGLVRTAPYLLASLVDRKQRDRAKAALLATVVSGLDPDEVNAAGARYAAKVAGSGLRPRTLTLLRRHLNEGHEVLIASASLEVYLVPLAAQLGVAGVVGTVLEVDGDRLSGRIAGANLRAQAKLAAVLAWLGRSPDYAYGDSVDDLPLLRAADRGFRVRRGQIRPIDRRW